MRKSVFFTDKLEFMRLIILLDGVSVHRTGTRFQDRRLTGTKMRTRRTAVRRFCKLYRIFIDGFPRTLAPVSDQTARKGKDGEKRV